MRFPNPSPVQRAWLCKITYIVVLDGTRQEVILHRQSHNLNGIFNPAKWSARVLSGVAQLEECDEVTVDLSPVAQALQFNGITIVSKPEPAKTQVSTPRLNVRSSPVLCINIMRFENETGDVLKKLPLRKAQRKTVRKAVLKRMLNSRNKVVYEYRARRSNKSSVRFIQLTFTLTAGKLWNAKLLFEVRKGTTTLKTHSCTLKEAQTATALMFPLYWRTDVEHLNAKIQIEQPTDGTL